MTSKHYIVLLIAVCLTCSGCALIQLPFEMLSALINIAKKLPTPPPGVI
jgi:hypothetical protein